MSFPDPYPPPCVACRWCEAALVHEAASYRCRRPDENDTARRVTGEESPRNLSCMAERQDRPWDGSQGFVYRANPEPSRCGPQGRFFERKGGPA